MEPLASIRNRKSVWPYFWTARVVQVVPAPEADPVKHAAMTAAFAQPVADGERIVYEIGGYRRYLIIEWVAKRSLKPDCSEGV
jgi:hypothetical protein